MEIPILATKLFIPEPRKELVVRKRLYQKLDAGIDKKLILISAPAGFGKSTLVSSWANESKKDVAWLSLDKDDNQVSRFLNYLLTALQKVDNTIGKKAAQFLAAKHQAPSDAVLTNLINDLDTAGEEIFLVLEDYQFINNQAVNKEVAFLLNHCPKTLHLVIITRSDPVLPLTRLRAHGQMVELRIADLRFTNSEAVQFLNDVMGLCLDAESVKVLEERTEGWVAGLQMAALSIRDRKNVCEFIEDFSGTNRYILDYLLEEVLANHSPEIQRFLLYTSILRRFSASLCDTLLLIDESAKKEDINQPNSGDSLLASQSVSILEYLERTNIFLVSLDEERIWYRYHHLFADMLKTRLHLTRPDIIPLLHIRASTWLEQKGFISEAIRHLYCANEIGRAADLIGRYGPTRLAENDPSILQMADNLPQEMILARPKIGLYRAWLLITQGQIGKARQLLNKMTSQLSITDAISTQKWMPLVVSLAIAFLSPSSSDSSKFVPLPEYERLEEIPDEEMILRNVADFLYVMTLGRQGELDRAVEISVNCIQRENATLEVVAIPTLAPFLTRIYLKQGRLHAAASLCREYLAPIKQGDFQFIYTSGSMKINLGEVLYEWNRLEEAEQYIRDGLQANEPWQNIMTDGFGLVALTRVLLAKRDFVRAMKVVDQFEARLTEYSRPRELEEDLLTLRVRVQLAGGDIHNPSEWADQIHHRKVFQLHKEFYRLTLARIRLAQGKHATVEELLAGITTPPAVSSQLSRQLESNLLLAAAIACQQRTMEAFGLIDSCLAKAEPEGYIRPFLDIGEPIRELLTAYLQSAAPEYKSYAQKIMVAFSLSGQASSPGNKQSWLVDPLSERELEVLHLVATGRTNRDIARQLFIAPGTVKAHTSNIYRKLNVDNRTEAVARGRQIGILS